MRAREREAAVRRVQSIAPDVIVIWARLLPGWSGIAIAPNVIVLCEQRYGSDSPAERDDTIAHEIAHLYAWRDHGHSIQDHGPEWRKAKRTLDRALGRK